MVIHEPTADARASFDREGYLVVPGVFTAEECARFRERNARFYDLGEFSGLDTHMKDDCFDGLLTHPGLLQWVRALLGPEVACAQTLVFAKPPGQKGIAMHQESYYVETEPLQLLTCWVALDESGDTNGGLALLPGSHRAGLFPVREPADTDEHVTMRQEFRYRDRDGRRYTKALIAGEIADVPRDALVTPHVAAGGVVFFDGCTIHGSPKNRSPDRSRHAFSARFVRRDTWVYREDIASPRVL